MLPLTTKPLPTVAGYLRAGMTATPAAKHANMTATDRYVFSKIA